LIRKVLRERRLARARERDSLRHLGTRQVFLVGGDRKRGEDSDDGNDDHQLDEREALLHGSSPFFLTAEETGRPKAARFKSQCLRQAAEA
jgi:hypothetical protein